MRVADLVGDPLARRLYEEAARSGAVAWLFPLEPFEEALNTWLDAHGAPLQRLEAGSALERAVREVVADATKNALFLMDIEERARKHFPKRAPTKDLARRAVELAQEQGLTRVEAFRTPTRAFAVTRAHIPMPFDSNLYGWLYWHERQKLTALIKQHKRERDWLPISTFSQGSDPTNGSDEIDPAALPTLDTDPEVAGLASAATAAWRGFLGTVRRLLLNPGDGVDDLLSPDLRAGAKARDCDAGLAVAAAFVEVLEGVLDTDEHIDESSRWWGDLDVHFVAACRAAVPAKAEDEGWRSRVRANAGFAVTRALALCASDDNERALVAALNAWTTVHLKNFVQKGPSDDKPLIQVDARIDWWRLAVRVLHQAESTGTQLMAELATAVLDETAAWLDAKGVAAAAARWLSHETAALSACIPERDQRVDEALQRLSQWHHDLPDALTPPPRASLDLAKAGLPVKRPAVLQSSEVVLVAFIEVRLELETRPPSAEQVRP